MSNSIQPCSSAAWSHCISHNCITAPLTLGISDHARIMSQTHGSTGLKKPMVSMALRRKPVLGLLKPVQRQ